MEWNYLVSPSQPDGKNCVHGVLFCTFILLVFGVSVQAQLTHVNSFEAGGPIIMLQIGRLPLRNVMLPENVCCY